MSLNNGTFDESMMTPESFPYHLLPQTPKQINIKPGFKPRVPVRPRGFYGVNIGELGRKPIPEVLTMIQEASPGSIGLEDAKKITAIRLAALLNSTLSPKTTRSVSETITRVHQHLQDILLCRPFLIPVVLTRAHDFITTISSAFRASSLESIKGIQNILQQQQAIHTVVSRHGHHAIAPMPNMRDSARQALQKALADEREEYPAIGSVVDILSKSDMAAENMRLHILYLYLALTKKDTIPTVSRGSSQPRLPQRV